MKKMGPTVSTRGIAMSQSKWLGLVASTWLMASAGLSYTFAIFSEAVKESLSYSQLEVDLLATASDFGNNAGILAAILSFFLPEWLLLIIGSLMSSTGFALMALVSKEYIQVPFWMVAVFAFVALNGTTFYSTVALVSSIRNFPKHRGLVIGLLSGFLGLSGALYTNIYSALLPHSPFHFLLQLAVGPAVIAIIVSPIFAFRHQELEFSYESDEAAALQLNRMFFIMAAVASILFIYSIALLLTHLGDIITKCVAILVIILLVLPIFAPASLFCSISDKDSIDSVPQEPVQVPSQPESENNTTPKQSEMESGVPTEASGPESLLEGDDVTILTAIFSLNFWLNETSIMLAGGSALTAFDNMGQIVKAFGYGSVNTAILFGCLWTFSGIVAATYFSEYYLIEQAVPRPLMMCIGQLLMVPGHLLIASSSQQCLYLACVLIGLGYGSVVTLSPTIMSDLFGTKSFAVTLNLTRTALPIGSLFFSSFVAGPLYDVYIEMAGFMCFGPECFGFTFLLMALVSMLGSTSCFILAMRTKKIYRQISERHPGNAMRLEEF